MVVGPVNRDRAAVDQHQDDRRSCLLNGLDELLLDLRQVQADPIAQAPDARRVPFRLALFAFYLL